MLARRVFAGNVKCTRIICSKKGDLWNTFVLTVNQSENDDLLGLTSAFPAR